MEQDKLLKIILVAVAVFAIVTAGGAMYFFQDRAMLQAQLKELAKQVTAEQSQEEMARPQLTLNSSAPAISGGDKEMQDIVARLEAEKAGLEAENATLKKRLDEALREEAPGQSASDQRRAARRRRDPRQELEELRETDPEEYERRVSEMQAWQQRMQQRQENITNYLANLDTSKLSQD
ncbi:MAG: hypothetical protein IKS83_07720, partial [Victivallales bacterium]|nr:hypothetical protein [Victivallales bacterium]